MAVESNASACFVGSYLSNMQIFAGVLYMLFGIVALVGNISLIVAMYRAGLLHSGGYRTLVHYAVTDMLTGMLDAFYMPMSIWLQSTFKWSFVFGFLVTFAEFSRKVFLVFMASTRFYSVAWPLKARCCMHTAWYTKMIAVTWVTSVLLCLPLWATKAFYFDPCTYHWAFNAAAEPFVSIYGLTVNVVVTCIIVVAYPICFFKMLNASRMWGTGPSTTLGRRQSINVNNLRKERKILYLFCFNAVIFVLYWLPVYLFEMGHVKIPNYALFQEIMRGIQICYNPFVYMWLNSNIRKAVKKMLSKRKSSINYGQLVSSARTTDIIIDGKF